MKFPNSEPIARRDHDVTSHLAAKFFTESGLRDTHKAELFTWMTSHGLIDSDSGMTGCEIAAARGIADKYIVRKRLPDLLEDGYVFKVGIRKCTVTGREANIWAIQPMITKIEMFKGDYSFLSNFFVEPDGTHVEGEYQARKVLPIAYDVEKMTPSKAKGWGKKMRGKERPDWQQINLQLMEDLVMAKFVDHDNLRESLLATGDAEIVEGNNWHDIFWGRCHCPVHHGEGENHLGLTLMTVREWIK